MNVFDIEADGLQPTKIHCLSYRQGKRIITLFDYDQMREWLAEAKTLIGHNIIRFDIPVLERLLGIKIKARLIDTLALSWYLYPNRVRHGLEWWGEDYGVKKPKIDDWDNLTLEEYGHRCEEDVKINSLLWEDQWKFLVKLYEGERGANRLINYLSFKMDCAREQERSKWKVDIARCSALEAKLSAEEQEKVEQLREAMPKVPKMAKRNRPKEPYKRNGELSVAGARWFQLLKDQGLPEDHDDVVEEIVDWVEPKPSSSAQLKNWLYDLGWVPATFEFKRDKQTGDVRKIPQINIKGGGGVCPSIKRLYDKEPALELLDGLSIITHRLGILRGFLNNADENGWVKAEINGFTNTLRFKHSVVVNLPGVDKAYGEDVRGCLIAPEGYELCGSDMASLEDRTKQHYMWDYDPEYVKEMQKPDFDPHLDLALLAKAITQAQVIEHKTGVKKYDHIRKPYKATNYAAVYGSGAPTLARTAGVSVPEAAHLLEIYWKRNWSVRAVADAQITKVCNKSTWLYNPVSKFWYSLRHVKDKFSTLNQGTGVYCFDTWVKHIRSKRPQMTAQFHDEVVMCIKKGKREECKKLLQWAIKKTNDQLKLNRELGISIDFGDSYAAIH